MAGASGRASGMFGNLLKAVFAFVQFCTFSIGSQRVDTDPLKVRDDAAPEQ